MYKIIPETIFYGLDIDEKTLNLLRTAKRPTDNLLAYANFRYALRLLDAGDNDGAVKFLKRACKLDTRFAVAYWSAGQVLSRAGQTTEAKTYFDKAENIDPDHAKPALASAEEKADPVPELMEKIRQSSTAEIMPGLQFINLTASSYGVDLRAWFFDPKRFSIRLVQQSSIHGIAVADLLSDPKAVLALNGGFFDADDKNRLKPSGLLVINRVVHNRVANKQSGAFVSRDDDFYKIIWTKDLNALTNYRYVLQSGPILVESPGNIGIKNNDHDRVNRSAACVRRESVGFVVVRGEEGVGLSLFELATLLAARPFDGGLGCEMAINLDGGPSTQSAMKVNGVTDTVQGLWKIENAIVVYRK
jgi:tetratricopeptide (TPR) repeat protein